MSQHIAGITYRPSFDVIARSGNDRFDVTTTKSNGAQSSYSGLTLEEVVDYYRAWAVGKHWVRP